MEPDKTPVLSQTDPELMGIAYTFPLNDQQRNDDERAWMLWLSQWNPPDEWKQ